MPSRLNSLMVRELSAQFADVDTCFLVDFTGLDGRRAAELREQIRQTCGADVNVTVVKTSLARRVFAEHDRMATFLDSPAAVGLDGPTAVATGADDPVSLAKALADWAKKEGLLKFKGGVLAGRPLNAAAVDELAKIPPKPILMGMVVSMIAAPLTALLGVSQAVIRSAISVVDALAKKKSEGSDDAAAPSDESSE